MNFVTLAGCEEVEINALLVKQAPYFVVKMISKSGNIFSWKQSEHVPKIDGFWK